MNRESLPVAAQPRIPPKTNVFATARIGAHSSQCSDQTMRHTRAALSVPTALAVADARAHLVRSDIQGSGKGGPCCFVSFLVSAGSFFSSSRGRSSGGMTNEVPSK